MKKAVFLQNHTAIYKNNISDDISEYQQTNYNLRSVVKEYSRPYKTCTMEIPMCWSGILLEYIKKMISTDEDIMFDIIKSEHSGLRMKAEVSTYKFPVVKSLVIEATRKIDDLVQERLKSEFI